MGLRLRETSPRPGDARARRVEAGGRLRHPRVLRLPDVAPHTALLRLRGLRPGGGGALALDCRRARRRPRSAALAGRGRIPHRQYAALRRPHPPHGHPVAMAAGVHRYGGGTARRSGPPHARERARHPAGVRRGGRRAPHADDHARCHGDHRYSEPCMTRMPAIFFGHGNPMNAIETNTYTEAWSAIGASIPRPRAIVCVSAHWYLPATLVTAMEKPRTIHDFGGFPRPLYEVQYPAPGDVTLARRLQDLLAPLEVGLDHRWGFDHGTWS